MTPQNYARMAVANGVVAAVCDPHEIANVLGVEGIEFMFADSKGVRFNFNYKRYYGVYINFNRHR